MPGKFDWIETLANLRSGAMTLTDYDAAVRDGRIADREKILDDEKLQEADPAHPLGVINRGRRIAAADSIRHVLLADAAQLTDRRLEILHEALFDCSAAVREAMIVTLAFLGRRESLAPLHELQALERPDSPMSRYLDEAIRVIEGRERFDAAPKLRSWLRAPGGA